MFAMSCFAVPVYPKPFTNLSINKNEPKPLQQTSAATVLHYNNSNYNNNNKSDQLLVGTMFNNTATTISSVSIRRGYSIKRIRNEQQYLNKCLDVWTCQPLENIVFFVYFYEYQVIYTGPFTCVKREIVTNLKSF